MYIHRCLNREEQEMERILHLSLPAGEFQKEHGGEKMINGSVKFDRNCM